MKKLLLLTVAVIGVTFLSSCEKIDSDSLAGTTWKSARVESDSGWYQDVLTFTSTEATYVRNTYYGSTGQPITRTYTYDHPAVTINVTQKGPNGEIYKSTNVGLVVGKTMKIEMMTGDILQLLELKKQ